jgi:hypothetical protein
MKPDTGLAAKALERDKKDVKKHFIVYLLWYTDCI